MGQILTEHIPFKVDRQLAEAAIKNNKPLIVSGIIQAANKKNQNERVYPKGILEREVQKYQEGPIKENRALGELDHPDSSVVNLNNACHIMKKVWWDGNNVMGTAEILPTPAGNILKALFAAGVTIGISSRGMGSVEENLSEGTVEVQDDYDLVCFDFVSNPSTNGAYMFAKNATMNESKTPQPKYKYTQTNKIISDILCDNTGVCECIIDNLR
tara:strand:- start:115 stop:756 length:642 start_codon:yes stop_codon:yes gene_type:complete